MIFSDCGDNPGGGGTGRTTELLAALVRADAQDVLIGSFYDVALAARRMPRASARLRASFNSDRGLPCDLPFEADAEVVGSARWYDRRTARHLPGQETVARAHAPRCASAALTGCRGRDLRPHPNGRPDVLRDVRPRYGEAHTVAVKSRGHFRAGFRPWFPPEQVYEVDTEGLTSPVLERRQWTRLPRPVYPLDEHASWTPPSW